jgi:hypothetical protein
MASGWLLYHGVRLVVVSWRQVGCCIMASGWLLYHGVRLVVVSRRQVGCCIMASGWLLYHGVRLVVVSWRQVGCCIMASGWLLYHGVRLARASCSAEGFLAISLPSMPTSTAQILALDCCASTMLDWRWYTTQRRSAVAEQRMRRGKEAMCRGIEH